MAVTYWQDIRPKFRATDVACMSRKGVQLSDAGWMCDLAADFGYNDHGKARHVFDYLRTRQMPPDGGWPQQWLDIYQSWMDGGFQQGDG
jgi:hypothetical protein